MWAIGHIDRSDEYQKTNKRFQRAEIAPVVQWPHGTQNAPTIRIKPSKNNNNAETGQLVDYEVIKEICIDGNIYDSIGFAQLRDISSHERTRSGENVPLYHTFKRMGADCKPSPWKYLGQVPALFER